MDRLLAGAGATLTLTTYASDSPADVVDGEAPTSVAITDQAGTAVTPAPMPTRTGEGAYAAVLSPTLATLGQYRATWTWSDDSVRVSYFELVGGFLFPLARLRAMDPAFADETAFPIETLRLRRAQVEDRFTSALYFSPTLRGCYEVLDGDGSDSLLVTLREFRRLVTAAVDGTELSEDELSAIAAYPSGELIRTSAVWPEGRRNVALSYEHGLEAPPEDLVDAGLRWARYLLSKRSFGDERTSGFSSDAGGFFRYSLAGRDGYTGIPDVDAVLADRGRVLGPIG